MKKLTAFCFALFTMNSAYAIDLTYEGTYTASCSLYGIQTGILAANGSNGFSTNLSDGGRHGLAHVSVNTPNAFYVNVKVPVAFTTGPALGFVPTFTTSPSFLNGVEVGTGFNMMSTAPEEWQANLTQTGSSDVDIPLAVYDLNNPGNTVFPNGDYEAAVEVLCIANP